MIRIVSMLLLSVIVVSLFVGCDSTEPEPDEAVLVNQTGGPILYAVPGKGFLGPPHWPPDTIQVDLDDPSPGYTTFVAAGASSVLGDCQLPDTYASRPLHIWTIEGTTDEQIGTARLRATLTSEDYINDLRENDCRLVLEKRLEG